MTWLEFRRHVISLLSVNYRNTLRDATERKIISTLLDLQSFIEEYRQGHTKVYGPADVEVHGSASIGLLPVGAHVERIRFRTGGAICRDEALDAISWDKRETLACCPNALYQVAINPIGREFWVNPQVLTGDSLVLDWNGRKTEFADTDELPYDYDAADAVAARVSSWLVMLTESDARAAAMHEAAYQVARRNLYRLAKSRKWMRAIGDRETSVACNSTTGCGPYNYDNAIEWVAFGDSGLQDTIANTNAVAALVNWLSPDFVVQLGDANYPSGDPSTVFENVTHPFNAWVGNGKWYQVMGNHDLDTDNGAALWAAFPHLDDLNDGEYYYKFTKGYVDFFVLNSGDSSSAPELEAGDTQSEWLEEQLAASTNRWKVVMVHKPKITSSALYYPGTTGFDIDPIALGADLVLSAHAHSYERIIPDGGGLYLTSGLGGHSARAFNATAVNGSLVRYNAKYGVLRCSADYNKLQTVFYNTDREIIDNHVLTKL